MVCTGLLPPLEWADVEPGESIHLVLGGQCGRRGWVARGEHGAVVDRLQPPVCDGDVWVVGDD
jgi:hypothetical protein